jgi:hypothetical protein
MMQTGTSFNLQPSKPSRKGFKFFIAGTVALTAAMLASLYLYQKDASTV